MYVCVCYASVLEISLHLLFMYGETSVSTCFCLVWGFFSLIFAVEGRISFSVLLPVKNVIPKALSEAVCDYIFKVFYTSCSNTVKRMILQDICTYYSSRIKYDQVGSNNTWHIYLST